MLDAMRRGAVNWLSKILLALLVVAFAVWGVADVFRGYGRGTLARIGSTEISVEEYRQAYQDELASIERRMGGRRLTSEQAKLLGIEQRALSRLIGAAAIDTHARQLRSGPFRPGHRRHRAPGPRLPGPGRRLLPAHLPELSAPERHVRGALRRHATQGRGARAADRHAAGRRLPAAIADGRAASLPGGDARHRVPHPRLRQAHQDARARRCQAAGVLRAEQAPVRDARAAQDQRAAAHARRRQVPAGDRRGGDQGRLRAATRRSSTSPRSAASSSSPSPTRRRPRRPTPSSPRPRTSRRPSPSWGSRRAIPTSACSRART